MKQFLLVDDDAVMNLVHREMIQNFVPGSSVHMCESCHEALAYLQAKVDAGTWPDFILLDINMPEMNGFQVVERMEAFPSEVLRKGQVLMLSSSLHPDDKARAEASPLIAQILSKPLTRARLNALVQD